VRVVASPLILASLVVVYAESALAAQTPPCVHEPACFVRLEHASPGAVKANIVQVVRAVTVSINGSQQLVIRGKKAAIEQAVKIARAADQPRRPARQAGAPQDRVAVYDVDPALGPQIAAAITAFIQGLPPLPGPSASPAQNNVNVVVNTVPGQPPQTSVSPAVVLSPSQTQIVVRADPQTLDIIEHTVLPAFRVPPAAKPPSQLFQAYEVKFPIPNPLPASPAPGTPLLVTSSISDLASAVQLIINQSTQADVRLTADPSYPRIIVAGSKAGVSNAMMLLQALDKRPAQVDIMAQFYEIDTNAARNVGFQLPTGSIQTTIGEFSPPSGVTAAGSPIPATPPPVLSPQKLVHSNISIAAQLNLLSQRGHARLIASSHVATINGRRTILNVLNTIPFPVTNPGNSAAVPTVVNYQTGTTLEIVPMINGDGSISAYLHPVYSTLSGFSAQAAPLISSREAFTTFRLMSGQAAYISGLEEDNESDNEQRVPGIGNIPLIGHLFRNHVYSRTTTQLFIVLTASVADVGDLQLAPLEIDPSNPPRSGVLPREEPLPTPPYIPSLPPPPPSPTPSPTPSPAPRRPGGR
jgi:type II secretory pathway component GspD/PulD (secretin)